MFSALVAEGDRTKDHTCKPHTFISLALTILSLMDKGLVCAQYFTQRYGFEERP